jgi:hypothetical protein
VLIEDKFVAAAMRHRSFLFQISLS